MADSSPQFNQITALVILGLIVVLIISAGVYLFINSQNTNTNSQKIINVYSPVSSKIIEGSQILYLVENYLNEKLFIPQIYSYNIENNIYVKLFELYDTNSGLFDIHSSTKGILFIPYTIRLNNEVVYYDYEGNLIKSVFDENSANYNIQVNNDGDIFVFQSIATFNYIDELGPGERIYQVKIINMSDDSEIVLKAADFIYEGETMQYISPIAFDKDNNLYVIVSPNFGGDIGDHMIIYKVDIVTGNKEVILFTGVKNQYDSSQTQEEYLISAQDAYIYNSIYPEHNTILLKKGVYAPHEVVSYNYANEKYTPLFDPATIDNEADLFGEAKYFSPSGDLLVLKRCGYLEAIKSCEGFYKGFHILNIKTSEFTRDFLENGEFVAWLSDNEILYKDYREEAWDDIYHTLKKININTKETVNIYTQTTDRPYSPNTAKAGDKRYTFIGVINEGNEESYVQFEDWSFYQLVTEVEDKALGTGPCGAGEFAEFLKKAEGGDIYKLEFTGGYELLWTPNYNNWDHDKFVAFNQNENAICGAGGRYPLKAYDDKLLWESSCGSGAEYPGYQECEIFREEVHDYFQEFIDLKNGFTLRMVDYWIDEYSYVDAINTVKYGSPAQIFTFYPYERRGEFGGPVITISTFTIDERLSAKDVANLLQDEKIADKIESGTNECYFTSAIQDFIGINYYAFKQDNTDLTLCESPATEVGIVETVIMKNEGDQNVLVINLVTSNSVNHDENYPTLMNFISGISYQGTEIDFIN